MYWCLYAKVYCKKVHNVCYLLLGLNIYADVISNNLNILEIVSTKLFSKITHTQRSPENNKAQDDFYYDRNRETHLFLRRVFV